MGLGVSLLGVSNDPMHQFHITRAFGLPEWKLAGFDVSFTNASLFMLIAALLPVTLMTLAMQRRALVPSRGQSMAELLYGFVDGITTSTMGKDGKKFFPMVFTFFIFILTSNMVGMFPYFFTPTTQIIVTFAMAMIVITTVVVIGFYKNGLKFLKLFMPSGIPWPLYFLVIPIEIISFLSRPLTLSLRLFANMLAGHIMLKVFSGFVVMMSAAGAVGLLGSVLPLGLAVGLTALEFLVAFLQAYVFAILTCIYLNDALHPGH
ncbi:MAG: F0F1 ATP synthase subunit A [Caulobacterales bacterium]